MKESIKKSNAWNHSRGDRAMSLRLVFSTWIYVRAHNTNPASAILLYDLPITRVIDFLFLTISHLFMCLSIFLPWKFSIISFYIIYMFSLLLLFLGIINFLPILIAWHMPNHKILKLFLWIIPLFLNSIIKFEKLYI